MKWQTYVGIGTVVTGTGLVGWALWGGASRRAVRVAEKELKKWAGGLKEHQIDGVRMVKEYWNDGALQSYPDVDTAWSAAFISYIANKANPGSLPPAASHMLYAGKALRGEGRYRVHRSDHFKVKKGDLVLRNRGGGRLVYENIGKGHANSHVDIITDVRRGVARSIGGNKDNAVSVEDYPLNPDGSIADSRTFAILRYT